MAIINIKERAKIIPGIIPAINIFIPETEATKAKIKRGILGGKIGPIAEEATVIPNASSSVYPFSFIAFISIAGVALGVFALIVVLSVMNGFDKEMRERILSLVPHISVYSHLKLEDYEPYVENLRDHPEVVAVTPFAHFDSLVMNGRKIETARGVGLAADSDGGLEQLLSMLAPAARADFLAREDGLILGSALALRLGASAGDHVTLVVPGDRKMSRSRSARYENVKLVGVIETGTELDQHVALVHLVLASRLAGLGSGVSGFRVSTDNLFEVQRIAWELTSNLPPGFYSTHWDRSLCYR